MERILGLSLVILWFQLSRVNSQRGEEILRALNIQEGENATVSCSYKTTITNLQWYRQDAGGGPTPLILIRSSEREKNSGRLRATLDTATKNSSLFITAARAADAAAYFCATDAQCAAGTCSPAQTPPGCFLAMKLGMGNKFQAQFCHPGYICSGSSSVQQPLIYVI